MGGWIVANRSGGIGSLFSQSEEDVDTCSDREGGWGVHSEVRDGLPSDGVLLVVQGEGDLGGVLESLDQGIERDDISSGEEHEFQQGIELDGSAMAGALGVLTGTQEEVETQDNQVDDVSVFLIGGVSRCGHDGVDDTQRYGLFLFNRGIFDPICFDLMGEPLVQSNMTLGLGGILGVGESFQELGRRGCPPCLRNRLLTKSVHSALGVLGMMDLVPIDL